MSTETFCTQESNLADLNPDLSTVGKRLKYYRLRKGLRQKDLAALIGVDISTIRNYETCDNIPVYILPRLAQALDAPADALMDDYTRFISGHYGAAIREARIALGLSQAQFAKKLGIQVCTLSLWENEVDVPNRRGYERFMLCLRS